MILVDDHGERTMFPDRAAAGELADVPLDWADGAGAIHAPAYGFATPESAGAVLALLESARLGGAHVSLDAASVSLLLDLGVDAFAEIVARVRPDVLFANAAEARLLALEGRRWPGTTVVVKNGPDPVQVRSPDGESLVVPVIPVSDVRDTTGAGDAFAAGYLRATLYGAPVGEAIRTGNATAATVLMTPGAGSPTLPVTSSID